MSRFEHEPWCVEHLYDDQHGHGVCKTLMIKFGPAFDYGTETLPRGFLGGDRRAGDEEIDIYIDYLSDSGGGLMDLGALRCVREAVFESPSEFLAALDRMIKLLGDEVPARYERRPKLTPTSA